MQLEIGGWDPSYICSAIVSLVNIRYQGQIL